MRRLISAAVEEFDKRTCIRFVSNVELDKQDYANITITNRDDCYAFLGKQSEISKGITIDPSCADLPTILFLFMRVLGFDYEISRSDRGSLRN